MYLLISVFTQTSCRNYKNRKCGHWTQESCVVNESTHNHTKGSTVPSIRNTYMSSIYFSLNGKRLKNLYQAKTWETPQYPFENVILELLGLKSLVKICLKIKIKYSTTNSLFHVSLLKTFSVLRELHKYKSVVYKCKMVTPKPLQGPTSDNLDISLVHREILRTTQPDNF